MSYLRKKHIRKKTISLLLAITLVFGFLSWSGVVADAATSQSGEVTFEKSAYTGSVEEGSRVVTVGLGHDFIAGERFIIADGDDWTMMEVSKTSNTKILLDEKSEVTVMDGDLYHIVESDVQEVAVEEEKNGGCIGG